MSLQSQRDYARAQKRFIQQQANPANAGVSTAGAFHRSQGIEGRSNTVYLTTHGVAQDTQYFVLLAGGVLTAGLVFGKSV